MTTAGNDPAVPARRAPPPLVPPPLVPRQRLAKAPKSWRPPGPGAGGRGTGARVACPVNPPWPDGRHHNPSAATLPAPARAPGAAPCRAKPVPGGSAGRRGGEAQAALGAGVAPARRWGPGGAAGRGGVGVRRCRCAAVGPRTPCSQTRAPPRPPAPRLQVGRPQVDCRRAQHAQRRRRPRPRAPRAPAGAGAGRSVALRACLRPDRTGTPRRGGGTAVRRLPPPRSRPPNAVRRRPAAHRACVASIKPRAAASPPPLHSNPPRPPARAAGSRGRGLQKHRALPAAPSAPSHERLRQAHGGRAARALAPAPQARPRQRVRRHPGRGRRVLQRRRRAGGVYARRRRRRHGRARPRPLRGRPQLAAPARAQPAARARRARCGGSGGGTAAGAGRRGLRRGGAAGFKNAPLPRARAAAAGRRMAPHGAAWPAGPFAPHPRAVFQQLEVDYTVGRPRQDVWPTRAGQVPVVRMYGVNDAGERGGGGATPGGRGWCQLALMKGRLQPAPAPRRAAAAAASAAAAAHGPSPRRPARPAATIPNPTRRQQRVRVCTRLRALLFRRVPAALGARALRGAAGGAQREGAGGCRGWGAGGGSLHAVLNPGIACAALRAALFGAASPPTPTPTARRAAAPPAPQRGPRQGRPRRARRRARGAGAARRPVDLPGRPAADLPKSHRGDAQPGARGQGCARGAGRMGAFALRRPATPRAAEA
jgi:hypothetical protein